MATRRVSFWPIAIALVILMSISIGFTAALGAIWPGVYKFAAPLVCPSGYDDPYIVSDTYNVRPGETSTTFTMYCMNERGEVHDAGILRPMLLLFVVMTAVFLLLVLYFVLRSRRRSRRNQEPQSPQLVTPA